MNDFLITIASAFVGGFFTMLGALFSVNKTLKNQKNEQKRNDISRTSILFEILSSKRIFSNRLNYAKHKQHKHVIKSVIRTRNEIIYTYRNYRTNDPAKPFLLNMLQHCNRFLTEEKAIPYLMPSRKHRLFVDLLNTLSVNIEKEFKEIFYLDEYKSAKDRLSKNGNLHI